MVTEELQRAARLWLDDYDRRGPGQTLREVPALTPSEAYEFQGGVARLRERRGEALVGFKVGCTSRPIREQLGIDGPIFGRLFDTECHRSGVRLSYARYANLAVEGELAVRLSRDLDGALPLSDEDCAGAIEAVFPVIELHHFALPGAGPPGPELIAHNGMQAGFVLGERGARPAGSPRPAVRPDDPDRRGRRRFRGEPGGPRRPVRVITVAGRAPRGVRVASSQGPCDPDGVAAEAAPRGPRQRGRGRGAAAGRVPGRDRPVTRAEDRRPVMPYDGSLVLGYLRETHETSRLTDREKHLLGLAVTLTRGCQVCTRGRIEKARAAGIDDDVLNALVDVVSAVNAGVTAATVRESFPAPRTRRAASSAPRGRPGAADTAGVGRPGEPRSMKGTIRVGTTGENRFVVEPKHAIDFAAGGMPAVLCTPWLVWFLEHAAREAVLPLLEEGESTVGARSRSGTSPRRPRASRSPAGLGVVHAEGGLISFQLEPHDECELIARGFHKLQVIRVDRFAQRVGRKAAR